MQQLTDQQYVVLSKRRSLNKNASALKMAECAICLDNIDISDYCLVGCTHKYHLPCITDWAKVSTTCPQCKKEFSCIEQHRGGRMMRLHVE